VTSEVSEPSLSPRLIVDKVDEAIEFYRQTLDAELIERYALSNGVIVHAGMRLGRSIFSLAEHVDAWGLLSPSAVGGSPVLLRLDTQAPDAVASRMVQRGATIVIEISDRPYGKREGRVRDPFGHLWVLTATIENLSSIEIDKRLSA
jgi:PhnB protein